MDIDNIVNELESMSMESIRVEEQRRRRKISARKKDQRRSSRCVTPSFMLKLIMVVSTVAIIVYLCDQYSLEWVRNFNELVESVKKPI